MLLLSCLLSRQRPAFPPLIEDFTVYNAITVEAKHQA